MPKLRHSRGLYDTRYLQLDGSNANQNIDIGSYNFTANAFFGDGSGLTGVFPAGSIIAFGGIVAPDGWLLCDGTQESRATYAALFAIVGTNYGAGDGATTFHLPDLRGQFLRGRDAGAGVDPDAAIRVALNAGGNVGDNVGSAQADASALPTVAFTSGNESVTHTHDHNHGAIASGNQSASHNHIFTGNLMGTHGHADTFAFSGNLMGTHGHADTFAFSGNLMANHGHGDNFTTAIQSASHTHSHTHDVVSLAVASQDTSHNHTFTGSAMGTHNHTATYGNADEPGGSAWGYRSNTSSGDTQLVEAASAGTPSGTLGAQSAPHKHPIEYAAETSGIQSASHTHTINGAVTAASAGTPAGSITGSVTGASAGTPAGSITGSVTVASAGTPAGTLGNQSASHTHSTTIPNITSGNASVSHTHTITGGGDAETRPTNVYVNFIIKY